GAALAREILALRDDPASAAEMGRRARAAVFGRYDRRTATDRWCALLESLVGKASPAPAAAESDAAVPQSGAGG
ncbi:MAG: hypothetical protein JNJ48_00145, partial [Phycisphaerae bacterium]|nr:hypothetical protein [Phycisphaerae bacterium]